MLPRDAVRFHRTVDWCLGIKEIISDLNKGESLVEDNKKERSRMLCYFFS